MAGIIDRMKVLAKKFRKVATMGTMELVKNELETDSTLLKRVEDLIKEQLSKGEDGEEEKIKKGYSERYAKERGRKGRQTAFVDYRFEGDFYNSIKATVSPNKGELVDIKSDYEKLEYILGHYVTYGGHSNPSNLLRLNSMNSLAFMGELKPRATKRIRRELFGL